MSGERGPQGDHGQRGDVGPTGPEGPHGDIAPLIAESQAARVESQKLRRYIIIAGLAVVLPLLALLATVILGMVVLFRLSDVGESNRNNGRALVECTVSRDEAPPGFVHPDGTHAHECFERGQERQAEAIKQLVLAQECIADGVRGADLEPCVRERSNQP